jgi:hypothetical protein
MEYPTRSITKTENTEANYEKIRIFARTMENLEFLWKNLDAIPGIGIINRDLEIFLGKFQDLDQRLISVRHFYTWNH